MSALIHGSIIDDKKRLNYRVTQLFCPLLDGIALNSRGAKIVTTLDFIKNKGSEMSFNTGDAVIHKTDKKQRKMVVVTQVFKETPPREPLNKSVFFLRSPRWAVFLVTGSKNSGFGS